MVIASDAPCKTVSILGSTGSVGVNTVKLLQETSPAYSVEALTAYNNVELLASQAKMLQAKYAVVADPAAYGQLKEALAGTDIKAAAGVEAVKEAAARPVDWVMSAIVGSAGLVPTLEAIKQGTTVALANKECLVCAGVLMMQEVSFAGATLIPVDSEHSAIFQSLDASMPDAIETLTLTASGGPFRTWDIADMQSVTPQEALRHPNWDMGQKISIDSATMMNKGLEIIEAYHLFGLPLDHIDVVVHPESVIHSMVTYHDGSVIAQLGTPDMAVPIAFALGYPKRLHTQTPRLNLVDVASLTFEKPDTQTFPALRLARQALEQGGNAPVVLNTANEIAVEAFLQGQIGFLDIARKVEDALAQPSVGGSLHSIDEVIAVDQQVRASMAGSIAA